MSNKPTVFNFQDYVKAIDEVGRLKQENTNLLIKSRILDADRNDKWIRVDDRLPELSEGRLTAADHSEHCLVTLEDNGKYYVAERAMIYCHDENWKAGEWLYYDDIEGDYIICTAEVVAWRPWPEPYRR